MPKILLVITFCLSWCGYFSQDVFASEPLFSSLSAGYENLKVERVIKSDLVLLENGKKIRLIGLKVFDKPKKYDARRDENGFIIQETVDLFSPLEDQASAFAREEMENKSVTVEFDTESLDDQGNMWGYIFDKDGTMINTEILKQGFAELQIRPPNIKYADQLREAYREARHEKRGIHASQ